MRISDYALPAGHDGDPRILSVSLDLDNLWSYLKTQGNTRWTTLPSYLDRLVDVLLPWLERQGLRITVFVVGQDAALPANLGSLRALADAGHEIANHSFRHEPWLPRLSEAELAEEVALAEHHICQATGCRPIGFRAPGYSYTSSLLAILVRRGYLYDASTWPTCVGPLARMYYLRRTSGLNDMDRLARADLFGSVWDARRPLRAHVRHADGGQIVEIPVTTLPVLRLPLHMTYIGYLAASSETVALAYLRAGLRLCRSLGVSPSFLLHPPDFLGSDVVPELSFFPTMTISTGRKLELMNRVAGELRRHFRPVSMADHAAVVSKGSRGARVAGAAPDRSALAAPTRRVS